MALREILDARESEIRKMLAGIQQKQIEPLKLELAEIVAARRAVNEAVHSPIADVQETDLDRYKRMKYEDLALLALKNGFPNGATIQEVLEYARIEFGREISQGSFSPILSRLRQKGALTKNGHAWVYVETQNG